MWHVLRVWFLVTLAGVAAFADGPVPVSPGGNHGITAVSSRCPTFHWAVSGASEAIDLTVYRVFEKKTETEQVVALSLPGSTHGWTPSLGQCLDLGGRYAWSVRSTTETGKVSEWSEPRLFEVLDAPSADQVREALDTLERYLGENESAARRAGELAGAVGETTSGAAGVTGAPSMKHGGALVSSTIGPRVEASGAADGLSVIVDQRTAIYGRGEIGVFGSGDDVGVLGSASSNVTGFIGSPAGAFTGYESSIALYAQSRKCCDGNSHLDHTAVITTFGDNGADILALRQAIGPGNPGGGTNFITFFSHFNVIGEIQGDGLGGVEFVGSLASPSSDLAEYLPKLDEGDRFETGEVVGLAAGKLSRQTNGAERAMVVSTRPMITGGRPEPEEESRHALVAFLGQVPVRVSGAVAAGDLLVPSGLADGTAIAVSPENLTPERARLVLGRALEDSPEGQELATVKTLVGLTELSTAGGWGAADPATRYSGWLAAAVLMAALIPNGSRRWLAGLTCRSRT